jgi:peptidoglycan hydrolase-like protein with peptidoglycan-binding domain
VLGERTKQAIRRFEADAGMPVTGQPTPQLLDRLMSKVNQPQAASTE